MTSAPSAVDISLGLGVAEMAYLLQLQDTEAARISASWLRLDDEAQDPEVVRAGLSALIARGLATVDGAAVSFDSRLDAVAYSLATPARWTQIDLLRSAELGDSVLHVETAKTKFLLQPRTMQSWFVLPQDEAISAEAAQAYVIREHLTEHPDGGVRLRSEPGGGGRQLLVRKDHDGWVCATAENDQVGAASAPLDDAGLLQELGSCRSTKEDPRDG
ncbi:hypothetical protein [Arthrobacter sp. Soil763]|uniref:hypothetical protein n=1 Tax=Arthrobacter sp. Soil763 TaxID=1736402 RepID=UPI0006FA97A4|nr:hypothetical protein [Arthrobacter sp. Soil763]KRE79611.1 hypothetical protein ASG71_05990 [Arthrobacter sp. Soil763]